MYLRCAECFAASWVDVIQQNGHVKSIDCGSCGRTHVLNPRDGVGDRIRDHYRQSLNLASTHDLDMASAYSVLLGIMSLDQAEILRRSHLPEHTAPGKSLESAAPPTARQEKKTSVPILAVHDFDLGFAKAIATGHLTVEQALKRGDRDAFAANLMQRHTLSERLAYRVTDNRIGLREALQIKERVSRRRAADRPARNHTRTLLMLGLSVLVLGSVAWQIWTENQPGPREPLVRRHPTMVGPRQPVSEPSATEALLAATRVRTDEMGRVLEVIGPDPGTVLAGYCRAASSSLGLEPLEVTSTVPPFPEARLGLFRDVGSLESVFAIRIRQDARSLRWIAGGSGTRPIEPRKAPDLPSEAPVAEATP